MNTWQNRVLTALLFFAALWLHAACLEGKPNTPMGMLVFHGSAAMVDLALLRAVPLFLDGNLCDDMQLLCWASIAVNFGGWILYMAYTPPYFYNTIQWILSYIQWGRLFIVDGNNVNRMGLHLVRRLTPNRPKLHLRKKNQ